MPHVFNLECSDHVSDKRHAVDLATSDDKRSGYRQQGIAGADGIHDLASDCRDAVHRMGSIAGTASAAR